MDDIIERHGLRFTRINESHLEILREWRNSDFVRSKMIFQEVITPEMQLKWFHSLNKNKDFYFIVEQDGVYVGLASVKDVENKTGEPGFFLAGEQYKDTSIAALSSVVMNEIMFGRLGLEKLIVHVRKDNAEIVKLNLFYGYSIIEEKSTDVFYYMELDAKKAPENKKWDRMVKYLNSL